MSPSNKRNVEALWIDRLCRAIGYGNVIHTASRLWQGREDLPSGGAHSVGPCVAFTTPCDCEDRVACDWCCGCGWLTVRAKQAKDEAGE